MRIRVSGVADRDISQNNRIATPPSAKVVSRAVGGIGTSALKASGVLMRTPRS
jgi:hypothetical protein